jgi:hypothetical protein
MATIRKLSNGKYRADIRKNYTFIQAKTFLSKKQAEQWASDSCYKRENRFSTLTFSKQEPATDEINTLILRCGRFLPNLYNGMAKKSISPRQEETPSFPSDE